MSDLQQYLWPGRVSFEIGMVIEMKVLKSTSILSLVFFIAAGFAGCFLSKRPGKNQSARTTTNADQYSGLNGGSSVGEVAPNFQLTRMDGSPVSVSELRGHPAVPIFWTAWCPVGEVIIQYGVKNDWTPYQRGIPHPSIYIIDRAGIVRFVEVRQNFVFRVKMSTILDELRELASWPE